MAVFTVVARLEEVPPGSGSSFTVGEKQIAIFNVDGIVYAMDDSCQHKGASLGNGQLNGKVVTCRAHGWRYDVTTGSTMASPGYGVTAYPAKVVDGKILIAMP